MKTLIIPLFLGIVPAAIAQVAINNTGALPNASSMLDISSTSRGLLVPRMTMAQRNAIANPATGLMIFQTDNTPGYYFNSGTTTVPIWTRLISGSDAGLVLPYEATYTGNLGFFIQNTDNTAIRGLSNGLSGRGLEGFASGQGGIGVTGVKIGATDYGIGVYGMVESESGSGVFGQTSGLSGTAVGVVGTSGSPDGIGIYGENLSMSGAAVAIRGHVNSPEGFSGVFTGGRIYITGNVGIGTEFPEAGLQIKGGEWPKSFLYLQSDSGKDAGIRIYEGTNAKWHLFNNAGEGGLHLYNYDGVTSIFTRQDNAYVGIGTTTPAARLDVNGEVKISGGSPGPGKVLTSDANGLASWQAAGLSLPYQGTVTANDAFIILNENGGNAIHGISSGIMGIGVIGESINFGVLGKALYTEGPNWGVSGESASSAGMGVYGKATGSTGYNFGVWGESNSSDGVGVYGEAKLMTGNTYGVKGIAGSPSGTGMYGWGGAKGVYGQTQNGAGVYADATAVSGSNYGVYANTNSTIGVGIYGRASSSTGPNYGIFGTSLSNSGTAVYGYATSSSGGTAIKGDVTAADGFSGWFNGGKFYINGRAGFGTTMPGAGLHLKATGFPNSFMFLEAADNQDAGLRFYEGTLDQWHIFNSASADGLHMYNRAGTTAFFARQSNGYVAIGNTAPTQMLDVSGTIRVRGMGTGAVAGTVSRTTDGTLITGSSDIRLKDDIQPLLNSLQKVLQLQGVSFRWKTDPQKRKAIGLVAQDLEKVFPELVFTNENDGYKGINYAELTAVLIEAIKELKTEVECLKAEVEKRRK